MRARGRAPRRAHPGSPPRCLGSTRRGRGPRVDTAPPELGRDRFAYRGITPPRVGKPTRHPHCKFTGFAAAVCTNFVTSISTFAAGRRCCTWPIVRSSAPEPLAATRLAASLERGAKAAEPLALHRDHVVANHVAAVAAPRVEPRLGRPADPAYLLRRHHLERVAERVPALRLDLAEDERPPAAAIMSSSKPAIHTFVATTR